MTDPDVADETVEEKDQTERRRGRRAENAGFYVALFLGALYALSETISHVGVTFGKGEHSDKFPFGVLIMMLIFCLPKILGRVTAGRIWEKTIDKIPGGR